MIENENWHIEPTSKCILECPLCDRTWFYETFKKRLNHEIDIDAVLNFFKDHPTHIDLCGNNGDPIYHSKIFELVQGLKKIGCKITLYTNASGKKKDWWEKFINFFDASDELIFSIDGLENTNHIYRKNADWDSISNAFSIIKNTHAHTVWKFIPFVHNQHQIKSAELFSQKIGFKEFRIEKSDRWLDNEELKPQKEFLDEGYLKQKEFLVSNEIHGSMKPFCQIYQKQPGKKFYIDAEGNFFPCCWMGSYRWKLKSIFSPKNGYNIKTKSMKDILENKETQNFYEQIKDFKSAHKCCKMQCGVTNG